jgi:regulator of replication initiation timing
MSKMNNLLFVSNIHTIMDEFKSRILAEYRVELETLQDVNKAESTDEVDKLKKERVGLEQVIGDLKVALENVHKERDILKIENMELKKKIMGQENMIGNMNVIIQSMGQRINQSTQLLAMYAAQYGGGDGYYGPAQGPGPYLNYPPPLPAQAPVLAQPNHILSQDQSLEESIRSYQEKVARDIYAQNISGSKPDF